MLPMAEDDAATEENGVFARLYIYESGKAMDMGFYVGTTDASSGSQLPTENRSRLSAIRHIRSRMQVSGSGTP